MSGLRSRFRRQERCDHLLGRQLSESLRHRVPRLLMRFGSVVLRPIHPGLASVLGMGMSIDLRAEAPDDHALRELDIQARPVSAYIRDLVEAEPH
jgi:hypothetical protein